MSPPRRRAPKRRGKGRGKRRPSLVERHRAVLILGPLAATLAASLLWAAGTRLADWAATSGETASPAVAERLLLAIDAEGARRGGAGRLAPPSAAPLPPAPVRRAIEEAARAVGVDPGYLMAVAARESAFDPAARARGSSAAGLYQFTDETWLRAVKLFGARHGLAAHAGRIAIDEESGAVSVAGTTVRARLLALRGDARLSALMAAELGRDNGERLARLLGRDAAPAEIYLAHFLGVAPAARLIEAARSQPGVAASRLLPAAAESNPGVFRPGGEAASAAAIVDSVTAYFAREVPRLTRT